METMKNFDQLILRFASDHRKKIAVVCPDDEQTLSVVNRCLGNGLAHIEMISTSENAGNASEIVQEFPDSASLTICPDKDRAASTAVRMVHEGKADVILKGNINTDNLLRAVLNKQDGLLAKGEVLSHVAVTSIPGLDRLLVFSDAAVIPEPDLRCLDAMLRYDVALCHRLGIECPKAALIHFTEKFNDKFVVTTYYKELLERAAEGQYGTMKLGGPMDVKCACNRHAADIKGIKSDVAGMADILIFPDLTAANTFYKTLSIFADAEMAAMLTGTKAPIVVPSRADSDESKFLSLALACVCSESSL